MRRALWIFLIVVLALGGCGYMNFKGAQNQMVELEEQVEAQWADVQNEYQSRADLVPNLVATVKGAADFEQETLTDISEARAQVGQMTVTKEVLEDPQAFERFQQAQSRLGGALSRLLSVSEKYPQLQANQGFLTLQDQLEGIENRISNERMRFNEASRQYNTYVKKFPQSVYANLLGFEEKQYFQAEQGAESAPSVNFSDD
jgi:LemA protein